MQKSRSVVGLSYAIAKLFPASLLLAFTLMGSCDSSSTTPNAPSPVISRTGEKSIVLDVGDLTLLPDNAFVTFNDGSKATVTVRDSSGDDISFSVKLENALGDDEQLTLNLSSYGLVTMTVKCVMNSNGELATIGTITRDTVALAIVRRLDGDTYPKTADGAIQAYADALLRDQSLVQPYPETFPAGLDTAKVRVEVLRRAAKSSQPLAKTVEEWGLPLSFQDAREQILALDPRISSSDSAILFPPPVRIQQEISTSGELKDTGDTVRIAGVISSDTTLASITIEILDDKGEVVTDKFTVVAIQPKDVDVWDLAKDGKVAVESASAPSGTYTIRIVGRDVRDNTIEAEVEIEVEKPDVVDEAGPTIKMVSPRGDTIVEHSVSSLDVVVSATDSSGVDSVIIGGGAASKNDDGNWHLGVSLDTAGSTTMVEIVAVDHAGNSSRDTASIARKAVPVVPSPSIRIVDPDPSKETVLPFDSTSLRVKWIISDAGEIAEDGVTISGGSANRISDSTWQAVVPVPATGKPLAIAISVKNKDGKADAETLTVTRQIDAEPPRIEQRAGSRFVSTDSAAASASWVVSDNHKIVSVTVQGVSAKLDSTGSYSTKVGMVDSVNLAAIIAIDSFGNRSSDTIALRRGADKTPPTIASVSPTDGASFAYATTSVVVRLKAQDASGIDSVTIQGGKADETDGEFRREVPLTKIGSATSIAIQVVDKRGNRTELSIEVTRKAPPDDSMPTLTLLSPETKTGQILPFDSGSVVVRWKIVDVFGIGSDAVAIDGKSATRESDSAWSLRVALSPTGNASTIRVTATNIKGTKVTDSVSITRRRDTIPPDAKPLESNPSSVPFSTTSAIVGWTVTDNHKVASVTIDGKLIAPVAGDYATTIDDLKTGKTKVVLVANDSMGNSTRDSFVVTREQDRIAPVATFTGVTKTITLDYADSSTTVAWKVTDNDALASVTIDGRAIVATAGIFSTTLNDLPLGETKVKLVAIDRTGNTASDSVTINRVLRASPVLTLSHPEGQYDTILRISISSSVPDAVMTYTIDGTDPSATNGLSYTAGGTILINQTRTLKVLATATGHKPSPILVATYTLKVGTPTFSLPAGTIADSMFTVNLASGITGVTYHYTSDGTDPVVGISPSTTTGFKVDSIRTFKVIATKPGWSNSDVISGKFLANIPVAVFVGMGGSKVIRADGSLWSTGAAYGLADGSLSARNTFEKVMEGVRAVDNGLILKSNGVLLSHGGYFGSTSTTTTQIRSGISRISSGIEPSAMLLSSSGDLFALGSNVNGQLCTGDSNTVSQPVLIASGVKDAGASCLSYKGSYSCRSVFINSSGNALGCGSDFGSGNPTPIPGTGYASVSLFNGHVGPSIYSTLALLKSSGELVRRELVDRSYVWTQVRTGTKKVVAAGNLTYSLEAYGWLYSLAWNGTSTDWQQVSNMISDVASDGETQFYIKTDGTLWATGTNGGKYGDGTTESSTTMKRIRLPN